jgi:recombination protein RecA
MSLEDVRSAINKKFKSEVLGYGNNLPKMERIPFGSARMNYLTRGGIPWPGVTEISGPEGGGKTTLLGDLTKQAQQMGLMCAFTDVENKTDLEYWKWLGVDTDNLLTCKPTGMSGEDVLQLQLDLMEQGVNFLGLDSVASLVPDAVLKGDMADKTYCGSSGILSTFSQKLSGTGITGQSKIAFVGINQVRDKINSMYGGLQTPGGHFWRHVCLCRIQVTKGDPFDELYKDMKWSSRDPIAGHTIEVNMIKNQFSKNDRKYSQCTLHYGKGIDTYRDLIDVAIVMDVIHRAGSYYQLLNIETGEILCVNNVEMKFQGKSNLDEYLLSNPRIVKWIEGQVNQHICED